MVARKPFPTVLSGSVVRIEPQAIDDAGGLFDALDDAEVWRWLGTPRPADAQDMRRIVEGSLAERAAGTRFPWTVRLLDGTIVGTSSYGDIVPEHGRIEIGWTSYGRPWWRTAVNTETKVLLLGHAFDDLGLTRVAFKTDARNERSRRAIERLGAVPEGVLRAHLRRPDGSMRDSVYYSVLAGEWPSVRRLLTDRLAADRAQPSV